jgi:hypothetical protein
MENIDQILYAIIDLHLKAESVGSLSPAVMGDIGKFTELVVVH